ncbi:MAG: hypothetical protein H7Y15_14880 [Pseudonocardia sp.]|nr:hypothetical protein [Pseudonocardia sp.]
MLALLGLAGLVAAIAGAGYPVVALLAGVLPGGFMLGGLLWTYVRPRRAVS